MNIFLTGGSRGLGRGLVELLLADGHSVVFTYRQGKEEAERLCFMAEEKGWKGLCQGIPLDVRDEDAVDRAAEMAADLLGKVSLVINNAAVNHPSLAINTGTDEWKDVIETNLTGAFNICRAFLMHFMMEGGGCFIHMGSIAVSGLAGQAAYNASKAGLEALSSTLAHEYGCHGIRSNVLRLGLANTDMSNSSASRELIENWNSRCPAGRMMTAGDLFKAVKYLSDPGAEFVNGSVITLDGGME